MKNIALFIFLAIAFAACNKAPKPYLEGVKMIDNGKYETAVDILKLVSYEDGKWYDSAIVKRNLAFELLALQNDWERTFDFIEKEMADLSYKNDMKAILVKHFAGLNQIRDLNSVIIDYSLVKNRITKFLGNETSKTIADSLSLKVLVDYNEKIKTWNIDSVITTFSKEEKRLIEALGLETPRYIGGLLASKVFTGVWKKTYGNLEMYFEQENSTYLMKNNVGGYYKKGKLLYKIRSYNRNMAYYAQGIVETSGWGYTEENWRNGTMRIINSKKIYFDYSDSPLSLTLVRIK